MIKFTPILMALLLLALLASTAAADNTNKPRRMLLGTCEDDCTDQYNKNVQRCIADTQLGKPPALAPPAGGLAAANALAYIPPDMTGFELVEKECKSKQDPELAKCKADCKPKGPDCTAVGKKCDASFQPGSMLAAWCRQESGC